MSTELAKRIKLRHYFLSRGLHLSESIMENKPCETSKRIYKLLKVAAIICMIGSFSGIVVGLINCSIVAILLLTLVWFIGTLLFISNERAKIMYGLDREENI